MLWLVRILLFITVLLYCRLQRINLKIQLFILIWLCTIKPFWQATVDFNTFKFFFLLSLFWLLYWQINHHTVKTLLAIAITVVTLVSIGLLSGYFSSKFTWNHESTFFVDGHYSQIINRFREKAVYFPFRLRPVIFGNWILVINIFQRAIDWLWISKIISIFGPATLYPLAKKLFKGNLFEKILIFSGVTFGVLSRSPNTSMLYFFLTPAFIALVVSGLKGVNQKLWISLVLINLLYQVTP